MWAAPLWRPPPGGSLVFVKQDRGRPAEPYNRLVVRPVVFTCIAAIVVFAVVQDRLTAAGVARYVAQHRVERSGARVTIDEVMQPAVKDAVRQGALWAGAVLATGLSGTLIARRRRGRE